MARTVPKRIRIKIRTSFNDLVQGDEATLELTPRVQGWLDAGLAEVIPDGTGKARPGGAEQGDNERVTAGADGSGSASREPGPGFGTGGYGTSKG